MIRNALILSALVSASAPALAQAKFESDVLFGRRWAETKDKDENGKKETNGVQMNDVIVAGRIQPSRDINAAFGPTISYSKFNKNDMGGGDANLWELGLEARTWYNVNQSLNVYGKGRYNAYSFGKVKNTTDDADGHASYTADLKTEGFHLAAGTQYNVTPSVALIAEIGYGVEMIRTSGGKLETSGAALAGGSQSVDLDPTNRKAFNSKSIMLGMNVSL